MGLFDPPEENLIRNMAPGAAAQARIVVDAVKYSSSLLTISERTVAIQAVLGLWLNDLGWSPELGLTLYRRANFIGTADRFARRFNEAQRDACLAAVERLVEADSWARRF
jgi:hypothetical protein